VVDPCPVLGQSCYCEQDTKKRCPLLLVADHRLHAALRHNRVASTVHHLVSQHYHYIYPLADIVTTAGWQVTLCDPIWRLISRNREVPLRTAVFVSERPAMVKMYM